MLGKLVAVWHGIVWYLREISGEVRYDHYLEHFAAEHPGETPMSEVEFIRALPVRLQTGRRNFSSVPEPRFPYRAAHPGRVSACSEYEGIAVVFLRVNRGRETGIE